MTVAATTPARSVTNAALELSAIDCQKTVFTVLPTVETAPMAKIAMSAMRSPYSRRS